MQTKFYAFLLKRVIPYIRFTTYYTSLRGVKYHKLYDLLQAGDVILSLDRKKLTTLLIPGEFSHACMCVSVNRAWEISEMTHTDYTKSTFFDVCKESDRVVIMRCKLYDDNDIEFAIERCRSFKDASYDLEFDLGVQELYCSELVYQSYADNFLGVNLEDLVGLDREYISPTGLYNGNNLEVIIDSDNL